MISNYTPEAIDEIQQAKISLIKRIRSGAKPGQPSPTRFAANLIFQPQSYVVFLTPTDNHSLSMIKIDDKKAMGIASNFELSNHHHKTVKYRSITIINS